jgi:hypothetical protein
MKNMKRGQWHAGLLRQGLVYVAAGTIEEHEVKTVTGRFVQTVWMRQIL